MSICLLPERGVRIRKIGDKSSRFAKAISNKRLRKEKYADVLKAGNRRFAEEKFVIATGRLQIRII